MLQGGGALGSYQAGVYQALAEANLHPEWVAGISIGAVNSALIAGNPPETRVEKLREFWEAVSTPPLGVPYLKSIEIADEFTRRLVNQNSRTRHPALRRTSLLHAAYAVTLVLAFPPCQFREPLRRHSVEGHARTSGGFRPHQRGQHALQRRRRERANRQFHLLRQHDPPHQTGACDRQRLSAARFPATEVDGEHYWDGGLVSNTPLQWVLDSRPRQDTLAFQVDLWNSHGEMPRDLVETDVRQKEIQYSSRTRAATDQYKNAQKLRLAVAHLIKQLPDELRAHGYVKMLETEADEKICNIVHLILRKKIRRHSAKDYEFSRRTMEEHWQTGYDDAVRTLSHPEVMQRPDKIEGVHTFDFAQSDG